MVEYRLVPREIGEPILLTDLDTLFDGDRHRGCARFPWWCDRRSFLIEPVEPRRAGAGGGP